MPDPDSSVARDAHLPSSTELAGGGPATNLPARRYLPEDWIGALAMALLALITFGNVLTRYLTNESFAWSEELSISLMVIVTMVAAGSAVVRDRHIRIEFFFASGSKERQRSLALLSQLATIAAFLIMFGLGLRLLWDDYRYEVTSPGIGVPQWWYTLWLPLLSLTIAARAMQALVRSLRTR
jgi:TRAP-type C4-dicarboxylate transport system permease small subunit